MPDAEQRYEFPVRGFLTKAERWLYPGGRPNRLARLLNRGWAAVQKVAPQVPVFRVRRDERG